MTTKDQVIRKYQSLASATISAVDDAGNLGDDGFITVANAAKYLALSRSTIYQLMDAGELPYHKFGRARRISRRALREFADRHAVGTER